jgi:replication-associated recombination protein RarA
MIVGNMQASEMIHQFFRALQEGKTVFPFLLLSGRSHLGKTTIVEKEIKELLWAYMSTDYVALYDLHEQLGKEHSIKIESPRGEEYLTLDEVAYCNRGIREVTHRLSRAPLGSRKVVYLENIERMTTAAANALLKSFEEPLPWRLIIASTSSVESLLDTIRSRALIVPFHLVTAEEVQQAIAQHYPTLENKTQQFVTAFSLGARGLLDQLLASPDIAERIEVYDALVRRFAHPTTIQDQMSRLQWVAARGQVEQLIDALLYAGSWSVDLLVQVKKLLQSNVGQDNILFWWCVESLRKS